MLLLEENFIGKTLLSRVLLRREGLNCREYYCKGYIVEDLVADSINCIYILSYSINMLISIESHKKLSNFGIG